MRARNPCFRCRRLFLGCHVRFMSVSLLHSVPGALSGAPSTAAWRHPRRGQQHERGTRIRSPAQSDRAGHLQQWQDVKTDHNTYSPSSTRPNRDALAAGRGPLGVGREWGAEVDVRGLERGLGSRGIRAARRPFSAIPAAGETRCSRHDVCFACEVRVACRQRQRCGVPLGHARMPPPDRGSRLGPYRSGSTIVPRSTSGPASGTNVRAHVMRCTGSP